MNQLQFKDFDDIAVSTKTYTATSNLTINISKLFYCLPITQYVVIPKRRGRKKKTDTEDPNKNIPYGSIVTVKYEDQIRGVEIKPKKTRQGKKKYFRNSVTVVIILDKPINFKICRNGTFQMTGCKTCEHAEICVQEIWKHIKDDSELYEFTRGDTLETLFIPSMRNIDFSLGFLVDRKKLNKYVYTQIPEYHCLLETDFGYTGVNIKVPLKNDICTMKVHKLVYKNSNWESEWTTYDEYLSHLSQKDRDTKLKEERYNTFLVFHSGKVIMSGLTSEFMRDVYYEFIEHIKQAYDNIEERLDTGDINENTSQTGLTLEEELALEEYGM